MNDDGSAPRMFDVAFDEPTPPVALEITSIVDPAYIATARASGPVADRLTRIARDEELGRLYVNVSAGTLRRIEAELCEAIGDSQATELSAGVISISRADGGVDGVVIGTWSSSSPVPLIGFYAELVEAIDSNLAKLRAAVGCERHLAVDLRSLRASDPALTPAPDLPTGLDVLWVVKRTITDKRTDPIAWWTEGNGWQLTHDWAL